MGISISAMFFLCFCVFLAGFIDSAAGGGGLISLPAYLFVGLPTHTAIGCNKFSAACGTSLSAYRFFKHGALEWRIALISATFSFITSYFGMKIALRIDQAVLKTALILILPFIAVILLIKRNFGDKNNSKEIPKNRAYFFSALIGTYVGFYDGLIGPGTGTIAIIGYSVWMKYDLKTASGNAKVLNLASNYASLIAVILNNKVLYSVAAPAAICGILGNYLGAGFALKKGSVFIRPLMIIVIVLLFTKLFYDLFGEKILALF